MSTLTKILIVLLTLSSIFLCGIVVTYVASASNYRQKYEEQTSELRTVKSFSKTQMNLADERVAEAQKKADDAEQKKTELTAQLAQMQADLAAAKQSNFGCQERLTNLTGSVSVLNQTISSMDQSLTAARSELDKARGESVKDRKALNEVTAALNEKSVQLDALENERRRLLEQKTALDEQLSGLGKSSKPSAAEPVTPQQPGAAKVAPSPTGQVSLRGKIVETDLKDKVVTISIGSADGVRAGMRFHVVRGDVFICDVVITNVDVDRSAGSLELVRQQPQVGDVISTNL